METALWRRKHHDPIVVGISDVNPPVGPDGDSGRHRERRRIVPVRAEGEEEIPVQVEHQDPGVPRIGDPQSAVGSPGSWRSPDR